MSRNICIFSDGTGQAGGLPGKASTNVHKLWQACRPDGTVIGADRQFAFYDAGLGAEQGWGKWLHNLLSRATGLGITDNIVDCYAMLIATWRPGDRIYLFGFSRGAYTVRSLGGVLKLCGIPRGGAKNGTPEAMDAARPIAEEAVKRVYMEYGTDKARLRRSMGQDFQRRYDADPDAHPYFIGVWDTVRALGVRGVNAVTDLAKHSFHDDKLDTRVPFARQALALDERRQVFRPELWDETAALPSQSIRQVWFPGAHSDVGGGYDDSSALSDLALQWMIEEATALPHPLLVDMSRLDLKPDWLGHQHDETVSSFIPYVQKDRTDTCKDNSLIARPAVYDRFGQKVPILKSRRRFVNETYRPVTLRLHQEFHHLY